MCVEPASERQGRWGGKGKEGKITSGDGENSVTIHESNAPPGWNRVEVLDPYHSWEEKQFLKSENGRLALGGGER